MKKFKILFVIFLIIIGFLGLKLNAQVLNVPLVIQEQTNWCWDATSKCVLDYYGFPNAQCTIADYTRTVATWHNFGSVNCCVDPSQGCNYWNYNWGMPGSIEDILIHFGNLYDNEITTYLSIPQIQVEASAGRPFIFRWGWYSGGGHFLVGQGISGTDMYYMNPLPGYGYEISNYNWVVDDGSSHTWTHTQTLCLPAIPDTISGNTNVCQGSSQIYSISPVSGATSYTWTVPSGWTGSSTSNTITATPGSTGGTISITANNSCGKSVAQTLLVTVNYVDTSITINGSTLISNANPATYQWVTCPTMQLIIGETEQTFSPSYNGSYAVILEQNSCIDTSGCYTVILTNLIYNDNKFSIQIYPNPTHGLLTIKCSEIANDDYDFVISDALGQKVMEKESKSINKVLFAQFDLKVLSSGIYFLTISSSGLKQVFKVQKQ
jgi:hypothetical protein